MKRTKKCLVTGGAGFIGSHLCESLLKRGYQVFCIDNLISSSEKNISHLSGNPSFSFFRFDVTLQLPEKFKKDLKGTDYIFHLASPASPPVYRKYSVETMLVNSLGTKNMLDLARENNSRFLFTSTSEVYGNPQIHPQKEDYFGNVNPIGVRACYDESKRFGEALIMEYLRKFNTDVRIIRIFNTYGPRMKADDGRVIVNFVNMAIKGKPLTIYGDGSITRSFCFVSDMVEGLILASESQKMKGEVINMGYPKEHTIKEIAEIIIRLTGSRSPVRRGESQEDDPVRRKPDISKAKRLLGWTPQISLENGLKETIEYFKDI